MFVNEGLESFRLDEETREVVLGLAAAIDIPRLNTPDHARAHAFLVNYGYDIDDVLQAAEVERLRLDALAFIERHLLQDPDVPGQKLVIPADLRGAKDPRKLMVWASGDEGELSRWACSLLRVMHTLTHVNNDLSSNFFPAIQKQILDRVTSLVHTDPAGDVYLGHDEVGLRLYMLDIKSQKSVDSLVLKMLHKSENVSSYIFDRIGFRFVTYSRVEALVALQYLKRRLFAFPNVISPRSRNTLINIERYHSALERLGPRIQDLNLRPTEFARCVADLGESYDVRASDDHQTPREHNIYSSTEYNSLQITCRQLVRVQGPPIAPLPGRRTPDGLIEYKFYFPYELQILDRTSYVESRRGRASHAEYKRAQLRSVRARIFPWLPAKTNA